MNAAQSLQAPEFQEVVDERFTTLASYWRDLYSDTTLFGIIHQERHRRALGWLSQLELSERSRILDLGCGAGVQAVGLAEQGYVVEGLDPVPSMLALGEDLARSRGVEDKVTFVTGDAHDLPYPDAAFDVVMALGVLPYLRDPAVSFGEVARVLKPGGSFLLSSNNAHRLSHVLDPRFSPITRPLKELVHRSTGGRFRHLAPVRTFTARSVRLLLADASFSVSKMQSYGFGPFTVFGRSVFGERTGVWIHCRLQSLTDRGAPVLRDTGEQHLILARLKGFPASSTHESRAPVRI